MKTTIIGEYMKEMELLRNFIHEKTNKLPDISLVKINQSTAFKIGNQFSVKDWLEYDDNNSSVVIIWLPKLTPKVVKDFTRQRHRMWVSHGKFLVGVYGVFEDEYIKNERNLIKGCKKAAIFSPEKLYEEFFQTYTEHA